MLTLNNLIMVFLIIFLTNIVQTITGFAGTMLSIPFLLFLMSMSDAKILIVLVGIVWSIWMLVQNYHLINYKFLILLSILMSIGILIGLYFLKIIPTKFILIIMAAIILVTAIKNMLKKDVSHQSYLLEIIFGISAGIMQAMVLMGGPFLVMVADNYLKDREEYRITLAVLWLVINIILLAVYTFQGLINMQVMVVSGLNIIPLFMAILVGNKLNTKINNEQFGNLINILLIISALFMLTKVF